MVTPSNPPHEASIENKEVRKQLTQLFGESLFGPWPELEQSERAFLHRRQSKHASWKKWLLRFSSVAAVGVLLWGGHALFRPGLQRAAEEHRANLAEELQAFVNDGDLEHASEFVLLVRGNTARPGGDVLYPNDVHLDLIVGTEAVLYRYFDADAARVRRIQPFLQATSQGAPLRQLAALTIQSREERAARVADLERLRGQFPSKNEPAYLLATALESQNDVRVTREAWSRSAQLGPAWLGQRFEQAWFELRHGDRANAQNIASQIVRVDPDSPWAKLAISSFALQLQPAAVSIRGDAAAPRVTPVQIHFERLQQSIEAYRRGAHVQAKEHLVAAAAAVHSEAPFLFDAFDWLMADGLSSLALELTKLAEWPGGSNVAASKLRRLAAAVAKTPEAPAVAKETEALAPTKAMPTKSKPVPRSAKRKVKRSGTK